MVNLIIKMKATALYTLNQSESIFFFSLALLIGMGVALQVSTLVYTL